MKTLKSLHSASEAAIDDVVALAGCIKILAARMQHNTADPPVKSDMADIRKYVAELSQRFHEFNAYQNAIHTD